MRKLTACFLALTLLISTLSTYAETFEIESNGETYDMTFEGVEVVDGQLVAEFSGYAGGLPIRNGSVVVPFWAYATKDGVQYDTASTKMTFNAEGLVDFAYTIGIDALPDEVYLYPDGAREEAVLVWSAANEPATELRSADDILWTEYRLRLAGATTNLDEMGAVVFPALGYLLMLTFEEVDGEAIPTDTLDEFQDELVLELGGESIDPDEIRPTVEEMGGEPQTSFSLIYYIPDGTAALADMTLSCEGLRYGLADVPAGDEVADEDAQASPFADEAFDRAVRAALSDWEGPLTDEALTSVGELVIDSDDCADISGLALLPNLYSLTINAPYVGDYSPIAAATVVESLSITSGALTDLSFLGALADLRILFLENCPVTDLSPLAGLSALESLSLVNCPVSDLSPLAGRDALTTLNLTACAVSDLSPLSGCAGLVTLVLAENPVADVSPIADLPLLSNLDLTNCLVADLAPLLGAVDRGLTVELSGNEATDMPAREAGDAMDEVLGALSEDLYAATREYLLAGETLAKGSTGEPAKGLQALIAALGKDITVDGNAGPKTMAALKEIEAAFHMDETDAVELATFDRLLMMLLIVTDEDLAYDLLADEAMEYDEFYYYAACAQEARGNYYSAMVGFQDVDYLDSAERAVACMQGWPKNGELYRNAEYSGKKTYLHIKVDGDADYATFIKIYAENGDYVSGAFIGGSSSVTVKLPGGSYYINKGTGVDWYGINETFGDDGYYATLYYEDDSYVVTLESGYEYTLTLNTSYDDPDASDVGTQDIGRDQF